MSQPKTYDPEILFEDNHLLVINKPAGMPSQGDASGDQHCFVWAQQYLREKYNKPGEAYVGLVHRIDRPVSGVLVLATTSKAAARLSKLFQQKAVKKTYLAITEAIPNNAEGELRHFLAKHPNRNVTEAKEKPFEGGKESSLAYKVLQTAGKRALIEVKPKTGRRHQIRVQLASMGCTIVGDKKYGLTEFLPDSSIALHAHRITFLHPIKAKGEVTFEAPLPSIWPWTDFS